MFDKLKIFKKSEQPQETDLLRKEASPKTDLLHIVQDLVQSKDLFTFLIDQLASHSGEDGEVIKRKFNSVETPAQALGLAKEVDDILGVGTFRKLSFVSKGVDAQKNVLRILSRDLKSSSFEGQAGKGLYLNIKENYGVEWDLEKVGRDILQNFFDANGATLDGLYILPEIKNGGDNSIATLEIDGRQEYDWRELAHLGGSTKSESITTAGGFGEGAKILSLVLLRDYGAQSIKFSSGDWEVEFYLDKVPQGSYRSGEDRGLFLRKKKAEMRLIGNSLEIKFKGENAGAKVQELEAAQAFFYHSGNPDFKNPSFEGPKGGFSVLERPSDYANRYSSPVDGNLYIAGQRIHYNTRDKWNNLDFINLWTKQKIAVKDRDRGMVTSGETKNHVIPLVVEQMTIEDAQKCVRDFEKWYDELSFFAEPANSLLEAIVDRLAKEGVKMEFKKEFFAYNFSSGDQWIGKLLKKKGYRQAPNYMQKVGMITGIDLFKKMMEPLKVAETAKELQKISILQKACGIMDLPAEDKKDVWIFSAENEKSIIHGYYMPDFFWIAREVFNGKFFDALHTYVHEAAHKDGPHGEARFEYTLQAYIKKIQLFMHDHREEYEKLEREWNSK